MSSSSSNVECQMCGTIGHAAMSCFVLDFKCPKCLQTMRLAPELGFSDKGTRLLTCHEHAFPVMLSIRQAIEHLKPEPEPPRSPSPPPPERCYHCAETGHGALHCPWKNLKCEVKNCPGTLWIREHVGSGITFEAQMKNLGRKYLECECCYAHTWLDEYKRKLDRKRAKFSKAIKDMCLAAKNRRTQ